MHLLIVLLLLSGCASLRPTSPSQKILEDYEAFVQELNQAVEAGEIDKTQAMVIEQQTKYQAMYAYQYQKQIENQQRMQSLALFGAMAGSMQSQQSEQPVAFGGQQSGMSCRTFDGGSSYQCN